MTFVRPYSGVFAYEGIIPSQAMNNINNYFPDALDKTGDTAAEGGGISGEIEVLSTGSFVFDGYSSCTFDQNSNINLGGNTIIESSGTCTVNSGAQVTVNGIIELTSSGTFLGLASSTFVSSGLFLLQSGSTALFSDQTCDFSSGTIATFDSASTLNVYGAKMKMTDNLSPTITTTTRNIAQPLVVMSTSPYTADVLTGQTFIDTVGSGDRYDLMLVKLPNGSVITSFKITITTDITAPTSNDATAELFQVTNATGALSSSLAGLNIPTGLSAISTYQYTSSTCSVTVDDSQYSYFVRVTASSTQPLYWYAPIIQCTITKTSELF